MSKPQRIQRKRTKGFNLQAESKAINGLDCVYVGRPTKWGNQHKVNDDGTLSCPNIPIYELITAQNAVDLFEDDLRENLKLNPNFLDELKGKNLACFCPLNQFCHADILLEYVNNA